MRARIYFMEARFELIKTMRMPVFVVPTIGFPLMFYVLFGLVMPSGSKSAVQAASYMLATYGAFGVIGLSLFGLGTGVATERGQGWLAVKRASPMPVSAYFFGKYAMTVAFSVILVILFAILGLTAGHVELPLSRWGAWALVLIVGGIPFCAMGLAIGYLAGPNSSSAVVQALYLPMSFLSGLFIPSYMLPKVLQNLAPIFPPYHLGQLALKASGVIPSTGIENNIAALVGFGVLFTGIAYAAYRRDEGKTYG